MMMCIRWARIWTKTEPYSVKVSLLMHTMLFNLFSECVTVACGLICRKNNSNWLLPLFAMEIISKIIIHIDLRSISIVCKHINQPCVCHLDITTLNWVLKMVDLHLCWPYFVNFMQFNESECYCDEIFELHITFYWNFWTNHLILLEWKVKYHRFQNKSLFLCYENSPTNVL